MVLFSNECSLFDGLRQVNIATAVALSHQHGGKFARFFVHESRLKCVQRCSPCSDQNDSKPLNKPIQTARTVFPLSRFMGIPLVSEENGVLDKETNGAYILSKHPERRS